MQTNFFTYEKSRFCTNHFSTLIYEYNPTLFTDFFTRIIPLFSLAVDDSLSFINWLRRRPNDVRSHPENAYTAIQ